MLITIPTGTFNKSFVCVYAYMCVCVCICVSPKVTTGQQNWQANSEEK